MKTKSVKKQKVNIVTLGCSKNIVDSEVLYSQLKANNIEVEHESVKDDADIVVINTCGFIDNAKQESVDTILRYIDAKNEGLINKVYVTGCLSQRYKPDLQKEIPEVDEYFGTMHLPQLLKALGADYKHELIGERSLTTPKHYAYLKISEGCDRPCSFCAIPIMRGGHLSKPIEQLVTETKNLVKNGTKELLLIAQDSTYYGLDIYKERKLADLLKSLSDIEGVDWIRLHYAYPSQFPLEVLDVMRERSNICKYIDMPLQHISDNMLKLMRRGITKSRTQELVDIVREKVPGITFRTTLIAGHPGETEKDFEELLRFVEQNKFERLGVFGYSHEEGTHSYSMPDSITAEEKEERVAQIMEVQQDISAAINQSKIGKTLKVLFDRKEGDYFIGRTEADSPEVDNEVLVKANHYVRIGDFADIRITHAEEFDLYGEPVSLK
ncbi:MAG: 30S ribosomal protein S12 methylthiotransferase RimO [Bacteroidia bacterium]|nr:30S ribosomal protein S12 methylthiotransferase RimO [Bacteroidia bacterium]